VAKTLIRQEQLRDIGGLTRETVTQAAHGFAAGEALYYDGSTWVKARADAISTAEVLGIVESVPNVNKFVLVYQGKITGLSGLVAGSVYFLSSSVAGSLTTVIPSSDVVNKPLLVAQSTTDAVVVNWRGLVGSGSSSGSTANFVELYSTTIGDGSSLTYLITPGMDTSKCLLQMSETATGKVVGGPDEIELGVTGNTQIRLTFLTAPTSNQYRVVVAGI
jgi:hypothetical protein